VTVGYSGTPLARKLGIKDGSRVLLVGAPADFDLGPVDGTPTIQRRPGRTPYDVALIFCRDRAAIARTLGPSISRTETAGAVWVAWPKKSSGVATDLDENVVRDMGLAAGVVDVKVCAVDATWSGLKFVRRLVDR